MNKSTLALAFSTALSASNPSYSEEIKTCSNTDIIGSNLSVCLSEGKEQISLNQLVINILNLNDEYNKVSDIKTLPSVLRYLEQMYKNAEKLLSEGKLTQESKLILNQVIGYIEDLKSDIIEGEDLFNIDEKNNPNTSLESFVLFNIAQKINQNFQGSYNKQDLHLEFGIQNKELYGFYYDKNNWFIDNKNNSGILGSQTDEIITETLLDSLSKLENQKIIYLLNTSTEKWKSQMNTSFAYKWEEGGRKKAKDEIVLNNPNEYVITDLLHHLSKKTSYLSQGFAIDEITGFMDDHNISSLEYSISGIYKTNQEINISNMSSSVLVLKSDSKEFLKFGTNLDSETIKYIKENTRYLFFIPDLVSKGDTKNNEAGNKDVLGLSFGGGIIAMESNLPNQKNPIESIIGTLKHEVSHAQKQSINTSRLMEETIANITEEQKNNQNNNYGITEDISGDTFQKLSELTKKLKSINNGEYNDIKKSYIIKLLERSDLMMHNSVFYALDHVYPIGQILGGDLIKGKVSYSELENLEYTGDKNNEVYNELKVSRQHAKIALNPNTSQGKKGSELVKIMNDHNSSDLEKRSAQSVLAQLFPSKFININTQELYTHTNGSLSWDDTVTYNKGVINGDIKIQGNSNISGNFQGVYDISIQGNVYDFSTTSGNSNSDIGGKIRIEGDVHNGNHSTTGNVTGGLTTEVLGNKTGGYSKKSISNDTKIMSPQEKYDYLLDKIDIFKEDLSTLNISLKNGTVGMNELNIIQDIQESIIFSHNLLMSLYKSGEIKNNDELRENINELRNIINKSKLLISALEYKSGKESLENDNKSIQIFYQNMKNIILKNNMEKKINRIINAYNSSNNSEQKIKLKEELVNMILLIKDDFDNFKKTSQRVLNVLKFTNQETQDFENNIQIGFDLYNQYYGIYTQM